MCLGAWYSPEFTSAAAPPPGGLIKIAEGQPFLARSAEKNLGFPGSSAVESLEKSRVALRTRNPKSISAAAPPPWRAVIWPRAGLFWRVAPEKFELLGLSKAKNILRKSRLKHVTGSQKYAIMGVGQT